MVNLDQAQTDSPCSTRTSLEGYRQALPVDRGPFPHVMKSVHRLRRMVRVMAILLVLSTLPEPGEAASVRFRGIEEGIREAETTGRPILFFFTAAWCAQCQALRTRVFSVGTYARLIEERFVPIEVVDRRREGGNTEEVTALLDRLGAIGFPTIVITRNRGLAAIRQTGFVSPENTYSFLRDAPARLEAAEKRARSAR